jgi:hypothetical protein
VTGQLYDRVRDLPIKIESFDLSGRSADTSYGFTRPTTVVHLSGGGTTGVGEDVTTDPDDHDRERRRRPLGHGRACRAVTHGRVDASPRPVRARVPPVGFERPPQYALETTTGRRTGRHPAVVGPSSARTSLSFS